MKLDKFNKRRGVIDRVVCSEGRPIAAYVTFKKSRGTVTILIPIKSIEGVSTVNHVRTLNLLRQTIL